MITVPLRVVVVCLLLPSAVAPSLLSAGQPVGGAAVAVVLPYGGKGRTRRGRRGLGKIADGPPTEINCSLSTSGDYSYYAERCHDGVTQWWINGRCVDGVKEEASELYRCARSDGSRPYCHDCLDLGSGEERHVCGADTPDHDEACGIAWSGHAANCGDIRLKSYSYQCGAVPSAHEVDGEYPPGSRAPMWYMCESFRCAGSETSRMGPHAAACGRDWHYAFEEDEHPSGEEHPFASPEHTYCLDCGWGLQVCAGEGTATCKSLGLPRRGVAYPGPSGASSPDDSDATSAEQDPEAPESTAPSGNENSAQSKTSSQSAHGSSKGGDPAPAAYPESHRSAWFAHGTMGAIAFGLLVPVAMMSPSLVLISGNNFFEYYYWTYAGCLHVLIFAAALCAVSTAVWKMEGMGSAGEGHLKEVHHIVGLLLLLLTSFQMVNGFPAAWLVVFGLGAFQVHGGLGLFAERFRTTDWGDVCMGYVAGLTVVMIGIKLCTCQKKRIVDQYEDEEEIQMSRGGGAAAFGESSDAKGDLMLDEFESQDKRLV